MAFVRFCCCCCHKKHVINYKITTFVSIITMDSIKDIRAILTSFSKALAFALIYLERTIEWHNRFRKLLWEMKFIQDNEASKNDE
jgi:hypothetical protein